MNERGGRCGSTLAKSTTAVFGAVVIAAGAITVTAIAHAQSLFNGTYTTVQKSYVIDARTGERIAQPDQTGIWIVTSSCLMLGCTASAVKAGEGFDFVFDGKQWNRHAVPPTGTCGGVTVPARAAAVYLVPQSDGSLSGAVTSTVDCGGATVDSSQPLTVTPW